MAGALAWPRFSLLEAAPLLSSASSDASPSSVVTIPAGTVASASSPSSLAFAGPDGSVLVMSATAPMAPLALANAAHAGGVRAMGTSTTTIDRRNRRRSQQPQPLLATVGLAERGKPSSAELRLWLLPPPSTSHPPSSSSPSLPALRPLGAPATLFPPRAPRGVAAAAASAAAAVAAARSPTFSPSNASGASGAAEEAPLPTSVALHWPSSSVAVGFDDGSVKILTLDSGVVSSSSSSSTAGAASQSNKPAARLVANSSSSSPPPFKSAVVALSFCERGGSREGGEGGHESESNESDDDEEGATAAQATALASPRRRLRTLSTSSAASPTAAAAAAGGRGVGAASAADDDAASAPPPVLLVALSSGAVDSVDVGVVSGTPRGVGSRRTVDGGGGSGASSPSSSAAAAFAAAASCPSRHGGLAVLRSGGDSSSTTVTLYDADGRGRCFALGGGSGCGGGSGARIAYVGDRCLAVAVPCPTSTSSSSSSCELIVLDPALRVISASLPLPEGPPRYLLSVGGGGRGAPSPSVDLLPSLLVVRSASGAAWRLTPRPLRDRLAALSSRNAFAAAISLAGSEGADAATTAALRRSAGDACLAAKDAAGAAAQYAAGVLESSRRRRTKKEKEATGSGKENEEGGEEAAAAAALCCLPASHGARKLIDAGAIRAAASYLEALHSSSDPENESVVSRDHTTLLVSCYAALRDSERLEAFLDKVTLRKEASDGGESEGPPSSTPRRRPLPLDARAAFDVCRSAGFSSAAKSIARAAGEHEWYVDVLLDDATAATAASSSSTATSSSQPLPSSSPSVSPAEAAADEALSYCASLSRSEAARVARRHGRALLRARPEAATALLMRLCTPCSDTREPPAMSVSDAAPLYGGVGVVEKEESGERGGEKKEKVENDGNDGNGDSSSRAALTLLCEFVLNSSSPEPPRDPSLYHTLLQLYLSEGEEEREGEGGGKKRGKEQEKEKKNAVVVPRLRRHEDALSLLRRGWPRLSGVPDEPPRYDPDTCLLLCRRARWHEGQLLLHERRGQFREAMKAYAAVGDHSAVVATALRHGGAALSSPSSSSSDPSCAVDPGLIPLALEYVAGLDDDAARPAAVELLAALMGGSLQKASTAATAADEGASPSSTSPPSSSSSSTYLIPPIVAIDVLSRNPRITLGDVKPFVRAALAADGARAAADAAEATRLRASAAAARGEARRLSTEPTVFQATRCAASGAPLELPTVHFLCGHSFNARALPKRDGDDEGAPPPASTAPSSRKSKAAPAECPLCGPGLRTIAAAAGASSSSAAAVEELRRLQLSVGGGASAAATADKFFSALRAAPDGFDAVADWVGRGLFAATG